MSHQMAIATAMQVSFVQAKVKVITWHHLLNKYRKRESV